MRFKVLKSNFYGISGGCSAYESIEKALCEIHYSRGWDSLDYLKDAIRKWAKQAIPGDVFATADSGIVCYGLSHSRRRDDLCESCGHEGLNYGDIEDLGSAEEADQENLRQEVSCPECGQRWMDRFLLVERRSLSKS